MKKLIFFLLLLLSTASLSAQSEQPSDSIRHLPSTVKQYGDFLIDMGLFIAAPPKLPKYKFELPDASKDYNRIFSLNPERHNDTRTIQCVHSLPFIRIRLGRTRFLLVSATAPDGIV